MKKSLVAFFLPLLAALGGGLLATPAAMAATHPYSADTTAPARRQGAVPAGGINWNCAGSRCSAFSSSVVPTVATCHALAQQVGPVKSYGNKKRLLSAGELQQCNAGIPTAQPSAMSAPLPLRTSPTTSPAGKPTVGLLAAPSGAVPNRGPVVVRTETLRYAGSGTAVVKLGAPVPVVVRAETLRYTGPGTMIAAIPLLAVKTASLPVVVRTETLRYTGPGTPGIKAGAAVPVVVRTETLRYAGR